VGSHQANIDLVILTHAHWDHVQNLDLFAHAPVALHASESRYVRDPHTNDWATPPWTRDLLDRHPQVLEVEEGWEPEDGVSVLHTPGHTAGSMAVTVRDGDQTVVIAGDTVHFADVALTRQNPTVFWSPKQARQSIDRVLAVADVIYPGHDRPFALEGDEVRYHDPIALTIVGIDPADPDVSFPSEAPPAFVMPGALE
jgi:glyoxylase-like metal-dependent hydrolase (beta-lactamase superfamily II)